MSLPASYSLSPSLSLSLSFSCCLPTFPPIYSSAWLPACPHACLREHIFPWSAQAARHGHRFRECVSLGTRFRKSRPLRRRFGKTLAVQMTQMEPLYRTPCADPCPACAVRPGRETRTKQEYGQDARRASALTRAEFALSARETHRDVT